MKTKNTLFVPGILLLLYMFPSCVYGDLIGWTGNAGTQDWYDSGNWDLNRVPTVDIGFVDWTNIVSGRVFVGPNAEPATSAAVDVGHFIFGGVGSATLNILGGTMDIDGGISLGDANGALGILNVDNGTLTSIEIGMESGAPGGKGVFNVMGSDASISVVDLNYAGQLSAFRELDTNFYLDVDGVAPIEVSNKAGLDGSHLLSAHGFTLQAPGQTYDLLVLDTGAEFGGTFTTDSPVTVTRTVDKLSVEFDEAQMNTWDISEAIYFSGDEQLDGWLKIEKNADVLEYLYGNLSGVTDEIAPLLQNFILAGMPPGTALYLRSELGGYQAVISTDTFIDGDYFGWGMSGFNAIYGTDVRLTGFDGPPQVPEPSTFFLLGIAAIALVWCKRRGENPVGECPPHRF